MMRRAVCAAAALGLLAACDINFQDMDGDGRLDDISPRALAALPPGVDPAFLIRDREGCYGIAIEDVDPPSGPALRDAQGNQICDA